MAGGDGRQEAGLLPYGRGDHLAELPYTCPDGKPVIVNLPFRDIEKRFGKRIGKDGEPEP